MRPKPLLFALCISLTAGFAACDQAAMQQTEQVPAEAGPSSALDEFQKHSPAIIDGYFRDNQVRKVQLGAGSSRLQGWLNTDIEPGEGLAYLDATKRFPFADNSVHYIFSEHVIEHLTYEEGKAMVVEAFRVLAPGGRMRISTPNLTRFIELFDANPSEPVRAYIAGKIAWHEWRMEGNPAAIILNLQMSSWGHKFMYDLDTLAAILSSAGFGGAQEFEENMSGDPHLKNLEERDDGVNAHVSAHETMSVEVAKPGIAATETRP
jgi:predicted SAM-dependent methyltransferase